MKIIEQRSVTAGINQQLLYGGINMSEISNTGYQILRDYIKSNWNYFEIRDNTGAAIIRIPTSNPRCVWSHVPGAQTLELTCTLQGSDTDLKALLPKTIGSSAFFTAASGGTALSAATFTAFTMSAADDQLTIKHQIQVPKEVG